ncbi:TetR/AcrR family transcriptional regulator C-terminal domain-containing protein [Streptacidiphilus sp. PAMC 29251]
MKLERDEVVRTAVRLLDEVGLDGLSMRRLAKELNVQAPALYWHFKNKQELLDHMLIAMAGPRLRVPEPGQSWDDWLVERGRLLRRGMLAHRDGARLAALTRPTPDLIPAIEVMVGVLREAGFSAGDGLRMILAISNFVTGSALEEQGAQERRGDTETPGSVDLDAFPNLKDAMEALRDPETIFEHGLKALVVGFRAGLEP